MNLYLGICIVFLLGFLAGGASTLYAVRWAISKFLSDAYHKYLLPEIMRVEGLLNAGLLEENISYIRAYMEMAKDAAKKHKEGIQEILRKYHKWV